MSQIFTIIGKIKKFIVKNSFAGLTKVETKLWHHQMDRVQCPN
jgi:hypothetical protein